MLKAAIKSTRTYSIEQIFAKQKNQFKIDIYLMSFAWNSYDNVRSPHAAVYSNITTPHGIYKIRYREFFLAHNHQK